MKIYDNLSMHAGEPAGTSLQRMNIVFSFLKSKGLVITDTMKDQIDDSMLNEKGKAYMDRVSDSIRALLPVIYRFNWISCMNLLKRNTMRQFLQIA